MQAQLNNSSLVTVEGQEVVFSTWISFAEVYNENVFDLLEPRGTKNQKRLNLAIGEDNKGQVYIKGKRSFVVNL
jgi:kinesin family protein 20